MDRESRAGVEMLQMNVSSHKEYEGMFGWYLQHANKECTKYCSFNSEVIEAGHSDMK